MKSFAERSHGLRATSLFFIAFALVHIAIPARPSRAQPKDSPPIPPVRVRVAIAGPSLSYLMLRIAYEKGFLKKRGIDVEFVQMLPPLGVPALLSREIDYTCMPAAVTTAAARGAPLKVISFTAIKMQHTIISRPEIQSPKDLSGKKIGIDQFGSIGGFIAQFLIDSYRLGPKTSILAIGRNEQRAQSVLSGIVDATNLPVPLDIKAEELGLRRLLEVKQVLDVPFTGIATTEEKIRNKRGEVLHFLKAVAEGYEYANSHRDEVASIISRWLKLTPQQAAKALTAVDDTFSPHGVLSPEQGKAYLSLLKATAGLREDISPKAAFDFSVAEEAARELGIRR